MTWQPLVVPMSVEETQEDVTLGIDQAVNVYGTKDYNDLVNKPTIDGHPLEGELPLGEWGVATPEPKTDDMTQPVGIDEEGRLWTAPSNGSSFIEEVTEASTSWTIHHNLGRYPTVTIVDSAGTVVFGDVRYLDENTVVCTFETEFAGKAYLN